MFNYLEYPASRGSIHITSKNPHSMPHFDSGFLNSKVSFPPLLPTSAFADSLFAGRRKPPLAQVAAYD